MAKLQVDISGNISSLEQALRDANSKLENFGKQAEKIGKELSTKLTLPLVALAGVSTKTFGDVEKGLREVNTLFGLTGDAAEENFQKITNEAREASKELGLLQSDVVPGLYNAISAGVPPDNALDFIKTAGRAAIGGVTDLNTAVDGLSSIVNAFNKDFSETGAVADSVFAAVQGGKTTFAELSRFIFQVAPAAAAAKVSLEEVNASIATLTASGTPTSVATTQIRAALTGLQRPSAEVDAIFQKLGFQNAQLAIESKGLVFALNAVKEATGGNNGQLIQLLGSVEAVAAANVLAGTGAAKFASELERQANAAGSAQAAFEEVDKSFNRQIERTGVLFSNLAIQVGEILAPAVLQLNNLLMMIGNAFDGLSGTGKTIAVVLGGIAAAIGPVLLVIGKLISFIPTLISGFKAVRLVMLAVSGPIGLIVAGVTLLAGAIIANWSKIKEVLDRTGVSEAFNQLGEAISEFVKLAGALFGEVVRRVKADFGAVVEFLKPVIKFFVEQFAKKIKAAITVITNIIGIFTDLLKGDFAGVLDRLKIIFLTLAVNMLESFRPIANFFGKGGAITTAIEGFSKLIEETQAKIAAKNPAKTIAEDSEEAIEEIKELKKELSTMPSGGSGGGQSLAAPTAIQGARTTPELSEFMQEIEDWKAKQVFKGMFDGMVLALAEVKMPFTDMLDALNTEIQDLIGDGIGMALSNMAASLGDALASGKDVIQALGGALLQSIAGFLSQLGDKLIAFAIAAGAFSKLQLALANPATGVVAAGTALAAGLALKALAGGIGAFGRSGGQSGGGSSVGSASSFIQPQNNQPIRVVVEGQINGETIYLTQQAFQNRINRTLGGR
jgi:TP901 family phage tail tape measure protein